MSTLPKSRIRIAGDLFHFGRLSDILHPSATNAYEETIPVWPRFRAGDSLQVEVGLFNNGTLLTDLSAIACLRLTIKPLRAADTELDEAAAPDADALRGPASNVAPITAQTLQSDAFNSSLTLPQWESLEEDKAHAVLVLSSAQAALEPGQRWLSLIAEGHDGETRTIAAGPIMVLGGGATLNALPQPIVEDLRDQAAQSASAAAQSAATASTSASLAQNAAAAASQQAQDAETHAQDAASSAQAAAQSATTSSASAGDAQSAANNANAAATDASLRAAQALTHRDAAEQAQTLAQTAASAAQAAADAAAQSNNAEAAQSAQQAHQYRNEAVTAATQAQADSQLAEDAALQAIALADALAPASRLSAGGVYFDGTNGYALSTASLALENGAHTISAVVTPQQAGPFCLLCQGGTTAGWSLNIGTDISLVLKNGNGEDNYLSATFADALVVGISRHITVIVNLRGAQPYVQLYIDGVLSGSREPATAGNYQPSPAQLCIGARDEGTTGLAVGVGSRISVFNRQLRVAEITRLAASAGDHINSYDRITSLDAPVLTSFDTPSPSGIATLRLSLSGDVGAISDGTITHHNPLRITVDPSSGSHHLTFNVASGLNGFTANVCNEISFDYFIPGSNVGAQAMRCFFTTGHAGISSIEGNSVLTTRSTWAKAHMITVPAQNFNASRLTIYMLTSAADLIFEGNGVDTVYLANIRIRQVGCTLHLPMAEGCGSQCRDYSATNAPLLLSPAGATHLIQKERFSLRLSRISSGFLGDADRPVLPPNAVIETIIWEDNKATRTTASLGFNASNATAHVAAWTPAQPRQRATLATTSAATADGRLYLKMDAAAGEVTLHITGYII